MTSTTRLSDGRDNPHSHAARRAERQQCLKLIRGVDLSAAWERHAQDWIAWAREPGHDGFWEGTWPVLRSTLPSPGGLTIDLGCGEGRVSRLLDELGYRVVGVDRSPSMLRAAVAASPGVSFMGADAAALPFGDCTVSLVVSCMSLHDIDDFAAAISEMARVLCQDGWLCVAVVHPFVTAQDDDTLHTDSFRVSRPYLQRRRYEDHVECDGLQMTFVSVHRPLSAYTAALARNGLVVTDLTEHGDSLVPWLLVLRARRSSHSD
jgi:SAM-dependent methyltransferase